MRIYDEDRRVTVSEDIGRLQACIGNSLDVNAIGKKRVSWIIGDAPSHYAKSPGIWNAAFHALKLDAVYLPFDVDESRLGQLVNILKQSERVMGGNVTVPYKLTIMDYLDELDEKAEKIKAVNTVVRTKNGRLRGTNTDGKGFLDSILTPQPGQKGPFIKTLRDMDVLMIGAGGAARAVAFDLVENLGHGRLLICNRTPETALGLAEEIKHVHGNTTAIKEEELREVAPTAGLIINCSTKGQGGLRKASGGKVVTLAPYSALAPAHPTGVRETEAGKPELYRDWLSASLTDIEANNRASLDLALSIPLDVPFCDLVYFPTETVFLRHGRISGHRTINGKGMNVAQAADAFFQQVCREYLKQAGNYNTKTYQRLLEVMWKAW
ncbi:MAG: shikimate dehydrogenase family protein [Candidatus Methylomirabilales bacterium]